MLEFMGDHGSGKTCHTTTLKKVERHLVWKKFERHLRLQINLPTKKWKCEKCSKKYAVQSDWKAHSKICGTREYRCDCGTLFSRRDSFITHRAFCDALAEESVKSISTIPNAANSLSSASHHINLQKIQSQLTNANHEHPFSIKKEQQSFNQGPPWLACPPTLGPPHAPVDLTTPSSIFQDFQENHTNHYHHPHPNPNPNPNSSSSMMGPATFPSFHHPPPPQPHISATALLQKAAAMGSSTPSPTSGPHHTHVSTGESGTAGSGLKLSSRDQFINGLAPFGNKAATGGTTCTTNSSPSVLLHDMMINNPRFHHQGSTFEDNLSFAGILYDSSSCKKIEETLDFDATLDHFSSSIGGNDDGMTRDFLGLRPLSQSDILSFVGLSQCMNTSSCNEHQSQT